MFRSRLFNTSTTNRGSFHSFQYFFTVTRTLLPFICIAPSPTSAKSSRSGDADFAAPAYGIGSPMVARFRDSDPIIPTRKTRYREYQVPMLPEPAAQTTHSGDSL